VIQLRDSRGDGWWEKNVMDNQGEVLIPPDKVKVHEQFLCTLVKNETYE